MEVRNTLRYIYISCLYIIGGVADLYSQEWQDQHVVQVNAEPAHAYFLPYQKNAGDETVSLNGMWKFRWTPSPDQRVVDFSQPQFDCSSWKDLQVPSNWEVNGYGTPIYISAGYPFRTNPPFVMSEPKERYTTFVERNPTGQYKRSFTLPASWRDGQTFIRFDGVMSAFYLWINGQKVGYSQGSMECSEFNITPYLQAGSNQIAVEVYKYSDASYLEDQDFWRFGGIHRDVTLIHTPDVRICDFTIRTIADDNIPSDYDLQISPLCAVHNGKTGNDFSLKAVVYDSKGRQCCDSVLSVEELMDLDHKAARMNEWYPQRGGRKFARLNFHFDSPSQWDAEHPHLYTLQLQLLSPDGSVVQQLCHRFGFRTVSIKDGQLLLNGKAIKLRGVNRHEHDPRTARVMSEERMLQDIKLMKSAHVNAVRLSHYPNVPRWYELCDSLGLYLMDEADCETHGLRGTLASTPSWSAAFLDRAVRMAERDKNFTSVIAWSLGNESGFGPNHAAMSGWLHTFDPTRFVHYEGAQGTDGQPDPDCVDVISRFYPRVKQEYLNPGIEEGSDKERAENARWEKLLDIANRINDHRPVLTSEYAHSMGNAMGNLKEYWQEIYSHRRMLGGFIWDWVDQGIYTRSKEGKDYEAYGGDFHDYPNLKAFCLNGVVRSDRSLTPKYFELKQIYSPIQFYVSNDSLLVANLYNHYDWSEFAFHFTLCDNGSVVQKGSLPLRVIDNERGFLGLLSQFKAKKQHDVRLNLFAELHDRPCWASKDAYVFHQQQIAVQEDLLSVAKPFTGKQSKKSVLGLIEGTCFEAYRAPTDNDKGFGNWIAKDWARCHLDSAVVVSQGNGVDEYRFGDGSILVTTKIDTIADGKMEIQQTYQCKGNLPELPRLGMVLKLPAHFKQVTWYGRGPHENYPDRKDAEPIGWYSMPVAQTFSHYARPQDCGNHEDCVVARLESPHGKIEISALDAPFSFQVLPYSTHQLATCGHDAMLQPEPYVYVHLDAAVMGLGNSSCGPGVLKKYTIDKNKTYKLHVIINGVK